MISMAQINTISSVLSQCDLTQSGDDVLILDRNGEIIGRIDVENALVAVFDTYSYRSKLVRRLRKIGIQVLIEDAKAGALKVLYDTPRGTPG